VLGLAGFSGLDAGVDRARDGEIRPLCLVLVDDRGAGAPRSKGSRDGDGDLAAGMVSEHVGDGGGRVVERVGLVDDHLDGAGL
jgi:hypothetical protein